MKEILKEKWVKTGLILLAVTLTLVLLDAFLLKIILFLLPFLLIGLFTGVLAHPVAYLEKKKVPRWLGTSISLLLLLTVLVSSLVVVIIQVVNGSKMLLQALNEHSDDIVLFFEGFYLENVLPIVDTAREGISVLNESQKDDLKIRAIGMGETVLKNVTEALQSFLEFIPNFIGILPGLFTGLIFVSLATFFLTKDLPSIKRKIRAKLNEKQITKIREIQVEIKSIVIGFVRAQLILIGMTFVIVWIGLTILDVKYAFLIAIAVGFVDLIPYLGTGFILWPWIAISFLFGAKELGIGLLIMYVVVVIQRNIVEPKVLSANIGLDPLSTLVAIYLGFQFFGAFGLVLGPIVLIIGKMIYKLNQATKLKKENSTL